jgi:mannose-6-phosphate isomerase
MTEPYPLLLQRRMSRRLWGGSRLAGYLGITDSQDGEPYGEAWQVFSENKILNGELAGRTLAETAARMGAPLLGTASLERYGTKVPLLAKFIDAAQPLSIQVHPDDEYALGREAASGHLGKAEAWYVLETLPGAEIIWGFREDMTREQVRVAVRAGELENYVNHIPVAPGDVIYNPEGTVHAIGAGLFLFEIQQASDLTYRLYDYARRGADGKERELHLDKALEVANLRAGSWAKVVPLELEAGRRLLVESRHFAMEALTPSALAGGARLKLATSPASLELLTVTRGSVKLRTRSAELTLRTGNSAVLPAVLGDYLLEGEAEILRCYLTIG